MKSARPVLPAVGDVIRYAYLWSHESGTGREEGTHQVTRGFKTGQFL